MQLGAGYRNANTGQIRSQTRSDLPMVSHIYNQRIASTQSRNTTVIRIEFRNETFCPPDSFVKSIKLIYRSGQRMSFDLHGLPSSVKSLPFIIASDEKKIVLYEHTGSILGLTFLVLP